MKKVYLFCAAGMSTSMLAQKMTDCAKSYNLPVEVSAHPHNQLVEIVKRDNPDCILLGPQVKYLLAETKNLLSDYDTPIDVISSVDYGMMDGEKVLKQAVKLIKGQKK